MANIIELFPLLTILMLLILGAFSIPLFKKKKSVYIVNLVLSSIVTIMNLFTLLYVGKNGAYIFDIGHYSAPFGIIFHIGNMEAAIGFMFSFVITMVNWYSYFSLEKEIKENRVGFFYILMMLLLASLLGIVYTYDVFNGFVFLEVSTLAGCGIIVVKDKKGKAKAKPKK